MKQSQEYLILHLYEVDKHDQYEDSLYMQPFVKSSSKLSLTAMSTNDPPPLELDDSQATKDDLEELARTMQHLDFKDPRVKEKVNKRAKVIWVASRPTQTRKQAKK